MAKKGRGGQPRFLGPTGPEVGVEFSTHAMGRMIERLRVLFPRIPAITANVFERLPRHQQEQVFRDAVDAGMPYEEICASIRQPNAGEPDTISTLSFGADGGEGRYLRTVSPPIFGHRRRCRVVFHVEVPQTDRHPGSILIVTFLPIHR